MPRTKPKRFVKKTEYIRYSQRSKDLYIIFFMGLLSGAFGVYAIVNNYIFAGLWLLLWLPTAESFIYMRKRKTYYEEVRE